MYTLTIPDTAFQAGGRLYGSPKEKAKVSFGIFGDYLTFVNQQLDPNGPSRHVDVRADATCTLTDEAMAGLSTSDRAALINYVYKGLVEVSKDGGAALTPAAIAAIPRL